MLETLSMLRQGGLIMFPLLVCSLTAATIVIERCLALRRSIVFDPRALRVVEDYAGETSAEQAVAVCRRANGPFARIVEEILKTRHLDHAHALETMYATGRTQLGVLERGLTVLEIIANVSPLLGLLGTVLGMVTVFNAITAKGIGNPQVLSDGISKALVTTVAGLCVAIPALAFHSWLSKRVDDFAAEMQDRATNFIGRIQDLRRNKP
ncbi:MAG TPA: MotA/TolQ/ExbB proton channel family protein [Candidatus Hydrogenedentes bacterium]|nr:MotA/TolQ/ExbB proton channel family protein [Candidatus Hydrogenedentota bacterium]